MDRPPTPMPACFQGPVRHVEQKKTERRGRLKITVSVVRFRPWAPIFSKGYAGIVRHIKSSLCIFSVIGSSSLLFSAHFHLAVRRICWPTGHACDNELKRHNLGHRNHPRSPTAFDRLLSLSDRYGRHKQVK